MNAEAGHDPADRIDRLLESEPIVWLSTVRPDGTPHLVPIWFSWDGERLFVASKPEARKVRNLRENPKLMLALGEPDDDFDVGDRKSTRLNSSHLVSSYAVFCLKIKNLVPFVELRVNKIISLLPLTIFSIRK